jgi:hypothetical protein
MRTEPRAGGVMGFVRICHVTWGPAYLANRAMRPHTRACARPNPAPITAQSGRSSPVAARSLLGAHLVELDQAGYRNSYF